MRSELRNALLGHVWRVSIALDHKRNVASVVPNG